MVHRVLMGNEHVLERIRNSPAARRIAMVLLLAGLGAVVWFTASRSPVESRLEIQLVGPWPALSSVRLAYFETESWNPLRQVQRFPSGQTRTFDDEPKLTPGSYRLEVTVDTEEGTRQYVRTVQHASGQETLLELSYEGK